jgi:hypothetical protein
MNDHLADSVAAIELLDHLGSIFIVTALRPPRGGIQ